MIPSKIDGRISPWPIKVALAFVTSVVFAIQMCVAQSNRERIDIDNSFRKKNASWEDSLSKLKLRTRPVYKGFDISLGAPQYRLNSNINVLNRLPVNYFGGMVGGMLANPIAKIKGGIGIYYSGDNVPYTFDLLTANLSVNLYLLRVKEIRYHSFEPYIIGGISQMKNKFYGYYLSDPSIKINHSVSQDPYIGSVLCTHLFAGAGVEYQRENDNRHFIHLYAEISSGTNLRTNATTEALSGSIVPGGFWITVGISVGKFK